MDELVSCGRLRWYEHVEHTDKNDWVSACRELQVEETRVRGEVK